MRRACGRERERPAFAKTRGVLIGCVAWLILASGRDARRGG
ncbi:hypothetical protein C7S16_0373 [Burkholderia thailandensis]|uniref:Uncharacterized protein n=1 Tax=Burkholderia thailandensis TaxID=57975 RepID=A0AAW9CXV4_BURTH|nr:hypothetical protein [Burkholderia thailandensis]MDW9255434.1 hypothetical protein [Burkholderia thailandensis]